MKSVKRAQRQNGETVTGVLQVTPRPGDTPKYADKALTVGEMKNALPDKKPEVEKDKVAVTNHLDLGSARLNGVFHDNDTFEGRDITIKESQTE